MDLIQGLTKFLNPRPRPVIWVKSEMELQVVREMAGAGSVSANSIARSLTGLEIELNQHMPSGFAVITEGFKVLLVADLRIKSKKHVSPPYQGGCSFS